MVVWEQQEQVSSVKSQIAGTLALSGDQLTPYLYNVRL